jgi:hypothetical protein
MAAFSIWTTRKRKATPTIPSTINNTWLNRLLLWGGGADSLRFMVKDNRFLITDKPIVGKLRAKQHLRLAGRWLGAMLGCLVLTNRVISAERPAIVVTPQVTDQRLSNPGMGWETFHRASADDPNLPSWIPSTVLYARWGWNELETQPGDLNTAFLDRTLKQAHDSGQKLAFRVMCCSTNLGHPYYPPWLKEVGGRILVSDHRGVEPLLIPDLDDPIVLSRHLDFIRRLGARYDGLRRFHGRPGQLLA